MVGYIDVTVPGIDYVPYTVDVTASCRILVLLAQLSFCR